MHQSHGVGYAEYCNKLSQRMKVEKEREIDYKQGQEAVKEMERLVHR